MVERINEIIVFGFGAGGLVVVLMATKRNHEFWKQINTICFLLLYFRFRILVGLLIFLQFG